MPSILAVLPKVLEGAQRAPGKLFDDSEGWDFTKVSLLVTVFCFFTGGTNHINYTQQ